MSLEGYRLQPDEGPIPTAAQHNGVLDHLARNLIVGVIGEQTESSNFSHPWKVKVQPFEKREGSTLDPAANWRIDLRAGTMNDTLPVIPFRRQNDPRGWQPPSGYVDPAPSNSPWIDRDVLDDLDDPPFLVARETRDFTRIADKDRIKVESGAFCGADDWERELWRAHVLLSATPHVINIGPDLPSPKLNRLRLYLVPTLPTTTIAPAGVAFELATLYLLRDPDGRDASELRVRQREHWPIWAEIIQPVSDLAAVIGNLRDGQGGLNDLIAQLNAGRIEETIADTATVEAWTV